MNREVNPTDEDYLGNHVFYWFDNKEELFKWVDDISIKDVDEGTEETPRFGGNFIDVEPKLFKKFINWVWEDCERVAIAGYGKDLIVDEIYLEPKDEVSPRRVRQKCHVSGADEVSMEDNLVRAWWD